MDDLAEYDESGSVWVIHVAADRAHDGDVEARIEAALGQIRSRGGGDAQLWIHAVTDAADAAATGQGFMAYRDLWQLRCPLPVEPSTLPTRGFSEADIDAVVGVNNRAFAWHPEQSGLTPGDLRARMREPWFDADGFRLFERDGDLLGFCWTKVHRDHDPVLGEIFVIAVDPSVHGQGLGAPMTRAGLDWLSEQGIDHGMLYVESDNDPANRTYRRIGFTHHHTDRAYSLTVDATARAES